MTLDSRELTEVGPGEGNRTLVILTMEAVAKTLGSSR